MRLCICWFLVSLICVLLCPLGWTQNSADLRGTVEDPSGLPIPEAKVVLESATTGSVNSSFSDNIGNYLFREIQPGDYRIRAEHQGFKSIETSTIHLDVNSPRTINLQFKEVGLATEITVLEMPQSPCSLCGSPTSST